VTRPTIAGSRQVWTMAGFGVVNTETLNVDNGYSVRYGGSAFAAASAVVETMAGQVGATSPPTSDFGVARGTDSGFRFSECGCSLTYDGEAVG
jgi:hypothetical protein